MDGCHILVGRPWQFDRRVTHDGFKNTYAFHKNGVNITLGPMDVRKEITNYLLSRTEFQREIGQGNELYALVVTEVNDEGSELPSQVIPLIEEYSDVVPTELPPGLPPMRDIQHCIDLVPGAVIPHKAAYRMSPREYEELQRQVVELMEKGFVRESMNPGAVAAGLVRQKDGTRRICCNSRAANTSTVIYRYHTPRLDHLIEPLRGPAVFFK